MFRRLGKLFLVGSLLISTGCANLVSGVTSKLADDLAASILNSQDIDTVKAGVPAYLLLIDSFLRSNPQSEELLLAASTLNGSFAVLVDKSRDKGIGISEKLQLPQFPSKSSTITPRLVADALLHSGLFSESILTDKSRGRLDIKQTLIIIYGPILNYYHRFNITGI